MTGENRREWYTQILQSAFETKVLQPADLMKHATPQVLVAALPADKLAAILGGALSSGSLAAEDVVETTTIETLSAHLPTEVLWASFQAAATQRSLDDTGSGKATEDALSFLQKALNSGLETKMLVADDVLRHATPTVLAEHLPSDLTAKLLQAGLSEAAMTAELVLTTLTSSALAEHLPSHVLWQCIAEKQTEGGAVQAEAGADNAAEAAAKDEPEAKSAAGDSAKSEEVSVDASDDADAGPFKTAAPVASEEDQLTPANAPARSRAPSANIGKTVSAAHARLRATSKGKSRRKPSRKV